MVHSFDIEIAKEYGINAAILLHNIYFWTEKNRANGVNIYDGKAWTYNSKNAFAELFPYLTARQIDYALAKLKEAGVIVTGNYNKDPRDQTLWYAITDFGYCILQNCEMEKTKLSTASNAIVRPLPDNKLPDNKPNKKQQIIKENTAARQSDDIEKEFNSLWELYPNKQGKANALKAYTKARKGHPEIYETVKAGIVAYKDFIKANKTERRFIKHGSTWFNQKAWEDDYTIDPGRSQNGSAKQPYTAEHPKEDDGSPYDFSRFEL